MSWFINRKTSFKLLSSFIFIAIILAGVSTFAIINMKKINIIGAEMYTAALKPMENMANAKNDLLQLRIGWRDVTLADSEASIDSKMEEIKKYRKAIAENITIYTKSYETEGLEAQQEAQEFHDKFMSDFEAYNKVFDEAVRAVKKDRSSFKKFDAELNGYHGRLTTYLEEIWDLDMSISDEEYHNAENMFSTTIKVMITIVILTLGICIALGVFLTKIIARPIHEMAQIMEKVAEGDLTEKANIQTKDEVGILARSVNHMIDNLRGVIKNIVIAAENLSASSEQVSASTEEIASASANQATSAQTMNELFRELSGAINTVAENTEQAAMLANKTMKIAQDGEKVVLSSVEGANLVSDQMARLEQDSSRIGEIIEVIDDIADQTNLLALNAAIEAARAGEQGRGFAVVADEVRNLAERSGEATKQISAIIKEMQKDTELSVQSVTEGVTSTQRSGEAFGNIIQIINETSNKVTEIAGASEEQAAQSAEVLTFIENISATTEETSASTEETASTAQALTDLAEELNASVASFKVN